MTLNFFSFVEGIGTIQAVLFILGLILLVVEMFTPGFGVAGGTGLVLLILGIILTARNITEAVIMLLILLVLVIIGVFIIIRSAQKGKLSKLVLHTASKSKDGYSTSDDYSALIGLEGVALTTLRPAGSGEFDGQRLDVVTVGDFIENGVKIRIIRTEGRRIVVEAIEEVK